MFQYIRYFAVGLLLQGPMRSLGIKCYYNNNGLAFNQLLFDLKHKTLSLVPSGETRDEPPVECQEETPLDKPYCLWRIEGGSYYNLLDSPVIPISGRNPDKYQQLCPESELADLQGAPDKGCKDVTLDNGDKDTVCVCFTDG